MGLESTTTISGLVATNPVGATDPKSEGDDHLRLIKNVLKTTFPNFTGVMSATHTQLSEVGTGLFSSTDAGAATGPTVDLFRNSASPAANDLIGGVAFNGNDSGGNKTLFAHIYGGISDPTNTSEDGFLRMNVTVAGASTQKVEVNSGGVNVTGDVVASVQIQGGSGSQATSTSADQIFAKGSSVAGILIETDGTGTGFVTFGDGTLAGRISYDHSSNAMTFVTATTTSATLDTNGNFSVIGDLIAGDDIFASDGSAAAPAFSFSSDTNSGMYRIAENEIGIATAGALMLHIHTTGVTSQGTLSAGGAIFTSSTFTANGNATADRFIAGSGVFSTTPAGTLSFRPNGQASTVEQMTYTTAGTLSVTTINTSANANISGFGTVERLISTSGVFSTSPASTLFFRPNGQANTSNQMTLTTGGFLTVQGGAEIIRDLVTPLIVNRTGDDGGLLIFQRAGVTVGTVSVAAGVVTYGTFTGAHISQWGRGEKKENILRGTVMETVNQVCYWPQKKDNKFKEILPKCKVSDTKNSESVYGVFANYDNDDDKGDVNIASLGTFVIRIEFGVKVKKGDLLVSAGNGCATVQNDDIIRAKTIAKVTATTVIDEYDDGSYTVPCTLHCG